MQANFLQSIWIKLYSAIISIVISTLILYYSYRIKDISRFRQKGDELLNWWSKHLLKAIRLKYTIYNPHHFQPEAGKAYIIMCNHSSFYDIPLSFLAINGTIRMITKQELFRVPLWGRGLKAGEFIPIDRKNRRKSIEQLRYAREKLLSGIILWIAPEGTRSSDGKLQKLKKGGFKIAKQTQAKIIPLHIAGAHLIYSAQKKRFSLGQKVSLTIGQVIDTNDYKDDEQRLIDAVSAQLK